MKATAFIPVVAALAAALAGGCGGDSASPLPTAATLSATLTVGVDASCEGSFRWADVLLDGFLAGRVRAGETGSFQVEGAGVHTVELRTQDGRSFRGELELSGEPVGYHRFGVELACGGGTAALSITGR